MRRLAQPADLKAVFAIYAHPRVVPYLTYEPMEVASFEPIFRDLVHSQSFWLWAPAGTILGFYKVTRYPGRARHVAQLGTLAVDPRHHGRGVGRAMIEDAIRHCRTEGVRRVELYAESDNDTAVAFYKRLGFVHEGTLRGFYKRAHEAHYVDEYVLGIVLE